MSRYIVEIMLVKSEWRLYEKNILLFEMEGVYLF
jgi:hypothetical protein